MSKESEFFIYLLEAYAAYKKTSPSTIYKLWDKLGLVDTIISMYEMYHIERIENAFDDIDRLTSEKRVS